MTTKLALTLAGIITIATTGSLGFSLSTYAQSNNTQESEIIEENETNTNGNDRNQNQRDRGSDSRIIIPSYPNRTQENLIYRRNFEERFFDETRFQRGRDFYNRLMEPYNQRYYLDRNPVPYYQNRPNYNRPSYRRYGY